MFEAKELHYNHSVGDARIRYVFRRRELAGTWYVSRVLLLHHVPTVLASSAGVREAALLRATHVSFVRAYSTAELSAESVDPATMLLGTWTVLPDGLIRVDSFDVKLAEAKRRGGMSEK